jgi:hypothetical protein
MNEQHIPDVHVFADAQFAELTTIGNAALTEVENTYGSGYPHYLNGEDGGLSYHNRHHSAFVRDGSEAMGHALGLTKEERAIAQVAGAAHDIVQLKPRGVMEAESADWLATELRRRAFDERIVQAGALAILGTEPVFAGGVLSQVASTQQYPSRSAEQIAMSVACADLGELYAPTGPLVGHELYREMAGIEPGVEPPMEGLIAFQRGQTVLTEEYQFPHPMGEQVFAALKPEVVAYSADVLQRLERGEIHSWDQLIVEDEAFMRRHS